MQAQILIKKLFLITFHVLICNSFPSTWRLRITDQRQHLPHRRHGHGSRPATCHRSFCCRSGRCQRSSRRILVVPPVQAKRRHVPDTVAVSRCRRRRGGPGRALPPVQPYIWRGHVVTPIGSGGGGCSG